MNFDEISAAIHQTVAQSGHPMEIDIRRFQESMGNEIADRCICLLTDPNWEPPENAQKCTYEWLWKIEKNLSFITQ